MKWFETALVVLTLLTGVIWLLDKLVLAKARARRAGLLEEKEPIVVDYAKAFFPVLFVVVIGPAVIGAGRRGRSRPPRCG
jgi:signal peptidase I